MDGAGYDKLDETSSCGVCAESPVAKEKAEHNKSLRTTIAVFLRHAEKRHKDALAKAAKEREIAAAAVAPAKSTNGDAATVAGNGGNGVAAGTQSMDFSGMHAYSFCACEQTD